MFSLFRKKHKKTFEDEFITMMNKMVTHIELKMDEDKWNELCATGLVISSEYEWRMLCRRFIDLINKIKKDKKSK
jgi:hypothetical protein